MSSNCLPPSKINMRRVSRRNHLSQIITRIGLKPWLNTTVRGVEHFPRQGPVLLVSNHVTILDPALIGNKMPRAIHWVASESMFSQPILGPIHRWHGAIPKSRFHADIRTIKLMKRWLAADAVVGIFPEGERTWTGETLPLVPGIEKLIGRLKVPVVACRMDGAHEWWPRWSPKPRKSNVLITFSKPVRFEERDEPAIREWLKHNLLSPSSQELSLRGSRANFAEGLSNLIFCCLKCGAGSIEEGYNALACTACQSTFGVGPSHRLQWDDQNMELQEAVNHIQALFLKQWAKTRHCDWTASVAMVSSPDEPSGTLMLDHDVVSFKTPSDAVQIPLESVTNVNVEFTDILQIRTRDTVYRMKVLEGSAWRWPWAINEFRESK